MPVGKILNGVLAIIIAGIILLVSDLQNRTGRRESILPDSNTAILRAVNGRTYKIGLTYFGPEASFDLTIAGLWDGLKELGFVKDSNLTVTAQHANGEVANLQPLHVTMDNQDVDMIVVTSTPGITAAIAAVKKHPMVFTMSYTPLEAGAGKSYTDHLPQITGVGSFPPVEKTIDFIIDLFPGVRRIGTVYNSSEINSSTAVAVAGRYASKKGIELFRNSVVNTSEVYQAASALCMKNIDAMWITGDNTAIQAFSGIVKVCRENKVPLIVNDVDYVKEGALAGVGVGWYKTGFHTATAVARVLNGEKPANIPIENFAEEEILFNTEVADKLNITIPGQYLSGEKIRPGHKYKFCIIHFVDSPVSEDAEMGIRDELKNEGLSEGKDYTLKVFSAQGDISVLNNIADNVAADKWDLVFTLSTQTIQLCSRKITGSPVVFSNVGDPIRTGLGETYEKHLPNITGISTMSNFEELVVLVKETIPGIKKIGTVFTPGEINSVSYKEELEKAANKHGLTLITSPANTTSEVTEAATVLINRGIEAFTQISDNLTGSCGTSIIKVAYNGKIPYFSYVAKQISQGAIAIVSSDYYYAGIDAVHLAALVLGGKPPGQIPFRKVSRSLVDVNEEAMRYFNVKVPEKYRMEQTGKTSEINQKKE